MRAEIADLKGVITHVFMMNSPRPEVKFRWDEIQVEIEMLRIRLAPVADLFTLQEISRVVARETYRFWKMQGFMKIRMPSTSGKVKMIWTNEKTALERACQSF